MGEFTFISYGNKYATDRIHECLGRALCKLGNLLANSHNRVVASFRRNKCRAERTKHVAFHSADEVMVNNAPEYRAEGAYDEVRAILGDMAEIR